MYKRMKYGGPPIGSGSADFEKSHKPTLFGRLRNRSDRIGRNPQTGWGKPRSKPMPKPKTDRELWLERIGIDVKR